MFDILKEICEYFNKFCDFEKISETFYKILRILEICEENFEKIEDLFIKI